MIFDFERILAETFFICTETDTKLDVPCAVEFDVSGNNSPGNNHMAGRQPKNLK